MSEFHRLALGFILNFRACGCLTALHAAQMTGLYLLGKVVPLLSGFTAHDSSGLKVNIFMVAKLPVVLV